MTRVNAIGKTEVKPKTRGAAGASTRCTGRAEPQNGRAISLPVISGESVRAGKVRASRMGRRRAAVLILINALMVLHVLQWWRSGRTVSPIEPSETMYTLREGKLNAGFVFFSLAILATLVLGRWVCGWGCHIVALQDLCGWIMKKLGVRPKAFRSRLLVWVPVVAAIYMFVWPTAARLGVQFVDSIRHHQPMQRPIPVLSNQLVTDEFWATFPSVWVAIPFLLICGFATVYFLGAKGFCTYACPYGGFFGLADKLAVGRIRVTDACEQCGHCTAVCTSNVQVHAEVRDYGMVVDPGCMKCMDCISVCPNDALYFGFGPMALGKSPRTPAPQAVGRSGPAGKATVAARRATRRYDLTWPGEIRVAAVFAATFFAVRGVYNLVPFLMALGFAGVLTILVVKSVDLFRKPDVTVQSLRLKAGGRIAAVGWACITLTAGLAILTLHSGYINYHAWRGDLVLDLPQAEESVMSAEREPAWRSAAVRASGAAAFEHFAAAERWGLVPTPQNSLNLAIASRLNERPADVVRFLTEAIRHQDAIGALWRPSAHQRDPFTSKLWCYLGAARSVAGDTPGAIEAYQVAARLEPTRTRAPLALGGMLAELGRLDDAIAVWQGVLRVDTDAVLAHHNLAGALRTQGKLDEALEHHRHALARAGTISAADQADLHAQMAVTLHKMGRDDAAELHLQEAARLNPDRYAQAVSGP